MPCISQHCKLKEIHDYHTCKQINNMKTIIEQHQHRTTNIRINHCHLLPAPTSRCTNINKSTRKPPARERCVGLGSVSAREDLTDCPERADKALRGPPPWGDWDPCPPENLAWLLHTIQGLQGSKVEKILRKKLNAMLWCLDSQLTSLVGISKDLHGPQGLWGSQWEASCWILHVFEKHWNRWGTSTVLWVLSKVDVTHLFEHFLFS